MMRDRQPDDYDAVLGALPSRAARQGGAVTVAWALVAGLIALVAVTPLLLPTPRTASLAAALPSAPHSFRE
jgi:hypothetical protein